MGKLKSKYQRDEAAIIKSMKKSGVQTFITQIIMVETSKIKGHQIYECTYVDQGKTKNVNVIAQDITDAVGKIESIVGLGVPQQTANLVLSRYTDDRDIDDKLKSRRNYDDMHNYKDLLKG